jgi:hypothetical protein
MACESTVASGRLNVVKGLRRTNEIVRTGESRHLICREGTMLTIILPNTTVDHDPTIVEGKIDHRSAAQITMRKGAL